LTPGINSIEELNLEISDLKIKLKMNKTPQKVEIDLNNPINSDFAKAKLKKKTQRLIIDIPFLLKK
jgi:methionine-rich copper-binding protein CopC